MLKSRANRVVAALALVTCLVALYWYVDSCKHCVPYPMPVDAIVKGMTYQQVEQTLGGPPVEFKDAPKDIIRFYRSEVGFLYANAHESYLWYDGHRLLHVFFDENLCVTGKACFSR
jgi:hypothetical protein